MSRKAIIQSTGSYAPGRELPNSYFNELLGEDVDTWLQENLHIQSRRWCYDDESVADLCTRAATITLERAGVKASELDLIIVATDTPEFISPSTACVVQYRLGAEKAGTFDLNSACSGFVTALDVAAKYIIADKRYNKVLVIGGYAMSKYLDMQDKKTVTLFADGAGAVLLTASEEEDRGFMTSRLQTKGEYNSWMGIYGGASHMPITEEVMQNKDHKLKFVHRFPKELNPQVWSDMSQEMGEAVGIKPADIDHYFVTQLNIKAIWETMDLLGADRNKAHTIMQQYGYTGSACIPMVLDDAVQKGKVKRGDTLFLIGSGGGLAFAGAAFRF
jgi:3-oxoacyl-[acyl-carrier-protein] synthase III